MTSLTRTRLLFAAFAVTFATVAGVAFAAIGDLTPQGCIDDNDSPADTCATSVDGLGGGGSPAVSADGRSVYAVSFFDDAIVRFDRDPATGALTYQGCIDDNDTGADGCATSVDGMDQPRGIAISPDGLSVYVTTQIDDAIVRFNRDPATGALTSAGCIVDNDTTEDACGGSSDGLDGAIEVDVSPDGSTVYAVSAADDAIVRFSRASDGTLTPAGCIDDEDTGTEAACPGTAGLDDAGAVEVSGDGKSVYVASFTDDAIVRFDRASDGALTPQGCIDDDEGGPDACGASTDGLDAAIGLALTPDGRSVYVVGNGDDALARFDRNTTTGALTPAGCIDDNDGPGDPGCAGSADGLNGVFHVVSSPGGATLYTSAQQDSAVSRFDRAADGALTPAGCVDDNDTGPDVCAASTDGMAGAGWSDLSADGRSLYVGAGVDNAVVSFGREPESGGPGPGGGGTGADTDPPETTIDKGPKKKTEKSKAKLKFSSDEPADAYQEGSTFECQIKGKDLKKKLKKFRSCSSPTKYKRLDAGKLKFKVRAIDAAGNVDPTPAKRKWKVLD